ncbi:fibronectin type III domain-containing protein [Candidatus Poriferisodalis sp.]|uniref:fibronectin type III domain-containing protein n=1 Tax=Candidatus Poriferisodalis sp. TaxID=3101277 RepID=UPI003D149F04
MAAASAPALPPNVDCGDAAVVAKLSVVEDRAAANMLAEAVRLLGLGGRCLVDAGDPASGQLPAGSRSELAGVPRVYVVGGPAAIPDDWLVDRLGLGPFTRVSGSDRWATQAAVASAIIGLAQDPTSDPTPRSVESPLNTDCSGSAVLAKLGIAEDRAAANMLAEALRWLATDNAKCLLDAGDPDAGGPLSQQAKDDYDDAAVHFVVGGIAALPESWLDVHFGRRDFERLAGLDRWATQSAVAVQIIELAQGELGSTDDVVESSSGEGLVADAQSSIRDVTVGVFYCGAAGSLDLPQLEAEVRRIDNAVGRIYRVQFGDSDFSLSFSVGGILSPDLVWADQSITKWRTNKGKSGCHDALADEIDRSDGAFSKRTALIIGGVETGSRIWGFATTPVGPAVVAARNMYPASHSRYSQENYYYSAIAHELGHLIYGFDHPHPDDNTCGGGSVSAEELRSIMAWPNCGANQDITGLTAYIACVQRESMGWVPAGSCDGDGPPPDRPTMTGLHPGDGSLTVEWDEPNSYRTPVSGYDVRYRPADGSQEWRAWQPDRVITGQSVTITGLSNGVAYEVGVRAKSRAGDGAFSRPLRETPQRNTAPRPTVKLSIGGDAQGTVGTSGSCTGVHCRWLHVEVEGLGPGPHTLACAHNGAGGYSRGVYRSATVTSWPNETSCVFGYPGAEVFVIVGAEHRDGAWHGGHYSNVVTWPDCTQEPSRCPSRTAAPRLRAADGSIAVRLGASIAFDIQYRQAGNSTWRNWHARDYVDIAGDGRWTTIDGLTNDITYEVRIRSREATGDQDWSNPIQAVPGTTGGNTSNPSVTLSLGRSAQGAMGVTGPCTSIHCRWLHIGAENIGPGPYNVECWHYAFDNYVHGPWKRTTATALPNESACLFGFPGVTVYTIVNGIKSNEVTWPRQPR